MNTGKRMNNYGFTLVELIIVLVILAILAAILIPALLGYIDEAKNKQDLLNAKNCLNAIQANLSELYAKESSNLVPDGWNDRKYILISSKDGGAKNADGDVNATTYYKNNKRVPNEFAEAVLSIIDKKDIEKREEANNNDPVIVIFGVGSNLKGSKTTLHEKYTVYFLMYQQTMDSQPLFYFNGTWSTTNPRTDSSLMKNKYYPLVGPLKDKRIQYYIISNKIIEKGKPNWEAAYAGTPKFWQYVDQF